MTVWYAGWDEMFPSLYVYFCSLHVSGNYVPIIRRNNCINTTPGICHCLWMTVWYAGWDEMFPSLYVSFYSLYVSGNYVPIIRRNNCINTTAGVCASVDDRLVCRLGLNSHPTYQTAIQNRVKNTRYRIGSYISWWWANICQVYVENRNKHKKKELCTSLVLFTRLYKNARSPKHKLLTYLLHGA
jgi:hypothetical protein